MKYFDISEFDCKHTGKNKMDPLFLSRLDSLRDICNFPFVITSGYRDLSHPVETVKSKGGTHTQGIAADIAVNFGSQRYTIVREAMKLGFTGIGIADSFIHVDLRKTTPVVWAY